MKFLFSKITLKHQRNGQNCDDSSRAVIDNAFIASHGRSFYTTLKFSVKLASRQSYIHTSAPPETVHSPCQLSILYSCYSCSSFGIYSSIQKLLLPSNNSQWSKQPGQGNLQGFKSHRRRPLTWYPTTRSLSTIQSRSRWGSRPVISVNRFLAISLI